MPVTAEKIWIPDSHADKQLVLLNMTAREYDERLRFGRNERPPHDWVVLLNMEHGQDPVIVLGFGIHDPPTPEALLIKLQEVDTRRHSDGILQRMRETNEQLKEPGRLRAADGEWAASEVIESFLHREQKLRYHRSLPKKDPKQRQP